MTLNVLREQKPGYGFANANGNPKLAKLKLLGTRFGVGGLSGHFRSTVATQQPQDLVI